MAGGRAVLRGARRQRRGGRVDRGVAGRRGGSRLWAVWPRGQRHGDGRRWRGEAGRGRGVPQLGIHRRPGRLGEAAGGRRGRVCGLGRAVVFFLGQQSVELLARRARLVAACVAVIGHLGRWVQRARDGPGTASMLLRVCSGRHVVGARRVAEGANAVGERGRREAGVERWRMFVEHGCVGTHGAQTSLALAGGKDGSPNATIVGISSVSRPGASLAVVMPSSLVSSEPSRAASGSPPQRRRRAREIFSEGSQVDGGRCHSPLYAPGGQPCRDADSTASLCASRRPSFHARG